MRYERAWAEIDLNNIVNNYCTVKSSIPNDCMICSVVKADAYGHGALEVAKKLQDCGTDYFAVATTDEAIELRNGGITTPILILGYTAPERAEDLCTNDLTQSVFSKEYAIELNNRLKIINKKLKIHIKIDTGMGRLGFTASEGQKCIDEIIDISKLDCFNIEGIYTHMSVADQGESGKDHTLQQFNYFSDVVQKLQENGIVFKIRHCANSATAIYYPQMALDMVRAGIVLYGFDPSKNDRKNALFTPAMTLKAKIIQIKRIEKGTSVSYGRNYIADSTKKIAVVSIGYADGFPRLCGNSAAYVTIGSNKAQIIGTICMDQFMVDVTEIENISVGDDVILFGSRPFDNTASDIAEICNTISYEILSGISKRVKRIYK